MASTPTYQMVAKYDNKTGERYLEFQEKPGDPHSISTTRFRNCYYDVAESFRHGLAKFDSRLEGDRMGGPQIIRFSGPRAATHCFDMGYVIGARLNIGLALQ